MSPPEGPWRTNLTGVILHPERADLLLLEGPDGARLPTRRDCPDLHVPDSRRIADEMAAAAGLAVDPLYLAAHHREPEQRRSRTLFVLVARDGGTPTGTRWAAAPARAAAEPWHAQVDAILAEHRSGTIPAARPPWARRGWYGEARGWIAAQLAALDLVGTGTPTPFRTWGISCLLQVPVEGAPLFFKAGALLPLFANEARLTNGLATLFPDAVPRPLALSEERGWMLLPNLDVPEPAPWGVARRAQMLAAAAELQIRSIPHAETLLACGALDRRLPRLAEQIDTLLADDQALSTVEPAIGAALRAARPALMERLERLAATPLPATLVHGDLHQGNVVQQGDGRFLFYDWSDGALAPPFVDLLELFWEEDTDAREPLLQAYLQPWRRYLPGEDLDALWRLARPLVALHHAVSYQVITSMLEPAQAQLLDLGLPHALRNAHAALEEESLPG